MSHELSVERGAIENHRMEIERIAKQRGLDLVDWYILPAVSGKTIWAHPEVVRMRADIQAGRIQGIVFTKLARLCRNVRELLDFLDFFEQHGAQMVCPEVSLADLAGRTMYKLIGVLAQMEREMIGERVSASVRPRAERAAPLGGAAKYGFAWKDRVLVRVPDEIRVIRMIYETFLRTRSYRTTAREISKTHRTRAGYLWSDSRVINILTEPMYRGTWIRNRSTFKDGVVREKEKAEWVSLPVEPVFTAEEGAKIDAVIDSIGMTMTRPAVVQKYLLNQIWCGECGEKVYSKKNRGYPVYYKCMACRNRILVAEMDALILGELERIHENDAQIAALKDQLGANVAKREALLARAAKAKAELVQVEAKQARVVRLGLDLGPAAVKSESANLTAQAAALEAEIRAAESEAASYVQFDDLTNFLDRVAGIPDLIRRIPDQKAKGQLLAALVPKILLSRAAVTYELNLVQNLPQYRGGAAVKAGMVPVANLQPIHEGSPQVGVAPTIRKTRILLDPSVFAPHVPLGKRFIWARTYLAQDRKAIARAWRKTQATLRKWEEGRGRPDVRRMEAYIAKAKAKLDAEIHGTYPYPVTRPRRRRG